MRVLGLRLAGFAAVMLCVTLGLGVATSTAGAGSLPDGRVYELVSPAASGEEANVYIPSAGAEYTSPFYEHGVHSSKPMRVATDGNSVVYDGEPPSTGGDGSFGVGNSNSFLAKRSPEGGWTSTDVQVPGLNVEYRAFSSDLSVGIVEAYKSLAVSTPSKIVLTYSHLMGSGVEGSYDPFFPGAPPNREAGQFNQTYAGGNSGTSDVPSFRHILFEANDALTPNGVDGGSEQANLYDSVDGQAYAVNVLPDGRQVPNATFGSREVSQEGNHFGNVISSDGSRVFWTALETVEIEGTREFLPKGIYVRENDTSPAATTVQVDSTVGGGGDFWKASTDGSKAFFTKGDLYVYDVASGQTSDLTPGVDVLGLVGMSDSGEYIYYVDSSYNLKLWHDGGTTLIATLSGEDDNNVAPFDGEGEGHSSGDWQSEVDDHTAQVTPDGHSLVFMSNRSLTGYDNEYMGKHLDEVFDYEAGTGELRCVSCDPTGKAPVSTEFDTYKEVGGLGGFIPMSSRSETYTPQVISTDGSRIFFDSGQPLVPQDSNGWLDVYEWEREGSGTCHESHGCVYLISGGADPEDSYLLGTGASGDDVFIISRAQLLAQDRGDDDVVYDARVGGVEPPSAPACSGTGCQGVPPAPPIFATPSSVTFNGLGNFPPPSTKAVKPKVGPLSEAQKLARALKACRTKRNMHKRALCSASARKRFGPKSKAKTSRRGK